MVVRNPGPDPIQLIIGGALLLFGYEFAKTQGWLPASTAAKPASPATPGAPDYSKCTGWNAPAGGDSHFPGSVRQLFMATYHADEPTAYAIWQQQGGRC